LDEGDSGELVALKDTGVPFLQYLDKINLHLGDPISILEKIEYDNSVIIEIKGVKSISISQQVADNLLLDV
jgi:DtxR family Mn-dependent transcriptional regulator